MEETVRPISRDFRATQPSEQGPIVGLVMSHRSELVSGSDANGLAPNPKLLNCAQHDTHADSSRR